MWQGQRQGWRQERRETPTRRPSATIVRLHSEFETAKENDMSTNTGAILVEPPSVAQRGQGVFVTGCPTCRKKFGTMPQFLDHLTDDVLPAVLDRLSTGKDGGAGQSRTQF